MEKTLRVAILDLNNNVPNRGILYLKRLVESYGDLLTYEVFDVRYKNEIPDTSFDIYISSGGPGSPFDFTGGWDKAYFTLIQQLWQHNQTLQASEEDTSEVTNPKYVFFICHSFQLACQHFKVGSIKQRVTRSFGTFPCHKTDFGSRDLYFKGLPEPFWIADFRDWQVVNANKEYLESQGFEILALEKERPHVNLPRAIMAIRFSDNFFGTQFHPEADADGMLTHFYDPERKAQVIKDYGEEKWHTMLHDLEDDRKINLTHKTILPNFLNDAIMNLQGSLVPA
ncbi:MAG: GMP synthase [Saprospiraceae bacterium]|nr:GMP synthase [Saprospiraceae bacterium]